MNKTATLLVVLAITVMSCQHQPKATGAETTSKPKPTHELLGYASKEAWGEHLVTVLVCDDCHSPKIFKDGIPSPDPALRLSGHPATRPAADVDRSVLEKNGYVACNADFTSWAGPWGISFSGNLTPDDSGIGTWSEEQFFRAIRQGKFKGLEGSRSLLPPMPWPNYAKLTDDELSAIFAYLKTLPPVRNIVPSPMPPLAAAASN